MDEKTIQELVQNTVNNAFKEIEVSNIKKEVEDLREANKALVAKVASAEEASIPEAKVDEITEVVEKAISDKVDSIVGEALKKAIDEVEAVNDEAPAEEVETKEEVEVKEEAPLEEKVEEEKVEEEKVEEEKVEEEAMTNRQRIKEALISRRKRALDKKKVAKSNAFKPMSRQSVAYTQCSDVEAELEAITESLKNAKSKKEIEDVKKLLQAFISTSAKRISIAEDLQKEIDDDLAELETYRALGSIDEIEAAVEVIETYADEIGSLQELKEEEPEEVKEEVKEEVTFGEFASKRKALLEKRKALISRKKALQARKAKVSSKRKALIEARKAALASKQEKTTKKTLINSERIKALKARREALANKKAQEENKISNSSRIQRIKELKEKRMRLASLKEKIKQNISTSSVSKDAPGALATALFTKRG